MRTPPLHAGFSCRSPKSSAPLTYVDPCDSQVPDGSRVRTAVDGSPRAWRARGPWTNPSTVSPQHGTIGRFECCRLTIICGLNIVIRKIRGGEGTSSSQIFMSVREARSPGAVMSLTIRTPRGYMAASRTAIVSNRCKLSSCFSSTSQRPIRGRGQGERQAKGGGHLMSCELAISPPCLARLRTYGARCSRNPPPPPLPSCLLQ